MSSEVRYKNKSCEARATKKNPDVYTKQELVLLFSEKFPKTGKSIPNRLTKKEICDALNSGKLEISKKTPKKKEKSEGDKYKHRTGLLKDSEDKKSKTSASKKKSKPKTSKPKTSKRKIREIIVPSSEKEDTVKIDLKNKKCIEKSKLKLKPHQIKVVEHLRQHRGAIVCHSLGSGKTLTGVTVSQCFLNDNPKGKVIVVTPVSLQSNFKKEMKNYGIKDFKKYEFHTYQGFVKEFETRKCNKNYMIIVDEAHNLRTDTGKSDAIRVRSLFKCILGAGKVLLLTATPIYNEPYDIANLVAMVKGTAPLSQKEFYKLLSDPKQFKEYFSCVFSFYTTKKQDKDYPTFKEHTVEIVMNQSYYDKYKKIEQGKLKSLGSKKLTGKFLLGIRQAANEIDSCPKCDWILKKVKETLKNDGKVLIHSTFLDKGIELITSLFDENEIKYAMITGKQKKDERSEIVNSYNKDKIKVLFISKAGGEGLDLKGTRVVINMESFWNQPSRDQVIGRSIRYKSHTHLPEDQRHVDIYDLILVKNNPRDLNKSADQLLKELADKKLVYNQKFLELIHPLSIENMNC